MGRHIFVVMATIALFGHARRRGVGLRHKKVRHACTGLGAGGSYGSGIGGSSIDGGGLSAGGGGVAGSTGPALTPGTWFVSQGDPGLTPSVSPVVGGGLALAMACVGLVTSLRRRSKHYAG